MNLLLKVYFVISLVLGTLYPAYRSYKAIKNKDLREHVRHISFAYGRFLFSKLNFINKGEMDDVLDRFCTLHNSRDLS